MSTPKTAVPVASKQAASQNARPLQLRAGLIGPGARRTIRALLWLSVLYFAVRLPWLMCVPITEAPDEGNHLWVAQFLREHLRLPDAAEVASAGTPAVYGSLPQLGYLPHLTFGLLFAPEQFKDVARFGSLLVGLPSVWFAWLLARELFSDSSQTAVNRLHRTVMPLLVVFHPQLAFTQSYTNNDSLAITLSCAAIYLATTAIKRGVSALHATALGAILGVAALSKYTTMTLLPVIAAAVIAAGLLNGASASAIALSLVLFSVAFSATCLWWFARNYALYGSDVLGTRTMYETWSQILPRQNGQIVNPWPPVQKFSWWRFVFFDFWGLFGYMNRYLWRPFYIALLILSATAVVGLTKSIRDISLEITNSSVEGKKSIAVWTMLLSCALLNFASVLQVTLADVSGPHGRYLFPSELAIMALLLAGFSKLRPGVCKTCTLLLLFACATANLSGFLTYYAP